MSAVSEPLLVMVRVPAWLAPGRMFLIVTMAAPFLLLVICSVPAATVLLGLLVLALKLPNVPGMTTAARADSAPAVPTARTTLALMLLSFTYAFLQNLIRGPTGPPVELLWDQSH